MSDDRDEWIGVSAAADLIGMSVQTVRNYCGQHGQPVRLTFRRTPGGNRQILRSSAEALVRSMIEHGSGPVDDDDPSTT